MKKNIRGKSNGITLIVLVITIIALVILAGVALLSLVGENGILKRSVESREQSVIGEEIDLTSLAYNGARIEVLENGKVTAADMNKQFSINGTDAVASGSNPIRVKFNETGHEYTLKDGKVEYVGISEKPEETSSDFFTWADNGDGTCTITGIVYDDGSKGEEGIGYYYLDNEGKRWAYIGWNSGYVGDYVKHISEKDIVIPEKINGLTVIGFGDWWDCVFNNGDFTSIVIPDCVQWIGCSEYVGAFSNCTNLTKVVIGNGITDIPRYTFSDCTSLTDITIPDSVEQVGYGAFSGTAWYDNQPDGVIYAGKVAYGYKGEMPENTEIVLRDDTLGIAQRAFTGQSKLKNITLNDGLKNIGYESFCDCTNLESFIMPDSVVNFESRALISCEKLATLKLSNQIDNIPWWGVYGCKALKNVVIPNNVTILYRYAFAFSSNIEKIVIPKSVVQINQQAFYYDNAIKDVYYEGSMEDWNNIEIGGSQGALGSAEFHYNFNYDDIDTIEN